MKRTLICLTLVVAVISLTTSASAKKNTQQTIQFESTPRPDAPLPPELVGQIGGLRSAAQADTFVLLDEGFDGAAGQFPYGWTTVDRTDQFATYFHAADTTQLNGGTHGNLRPIGGAGISMWCGVIASTAVPYCAYANLPGYGDGWRQILCSDFFSGDILSISYDVFWDSEGGYDGTQAEYTFDGGSTWFSLPITDSSSVRPFYYDNTGPTPFISEGPFAANGSAGVNNVAVRFFFSSDGAWSDEDGLWPTDGAIIIDNIQLNVWNDGIPVANDFEDFESWFPGANSNAGSIWTGKKRPAFGDYAALYPGVTVHQEDPCVFLSTFLIGFFDDPITSPYLCHTPNPLPDQGVVPLGPINDLYMTNEVWSPVFANTGFGDQFLLQYFVYRDMPLANLQFYNWHIRAWNDPDGDGPLPLCPENWRSFEGTGYYGGQRDWLRKTHWVGSLIDATDVAFQIALESLDRCRVWCNVYGPGGCHSHAPLFDDVLMTRVNVTGPQFRVRQLELFQDNFPRDGDISTFKPYVPSSTADADAAIDILPSASPGIQPGDSVTITLNPLGISGGGPAAWICARVVNGNDPKSGPGLGSPDTRPGKAGPRWPHTGTFTDATNHVWEVFQMDSAITTAGGIVADRYCIDLNDDLFVAGDTILYFLCADADGTSNSGNESYWHRTFDGQGDGHVTSDIEEAAASPCEFTILPAGGHNRGGDILYVDDTDDRGGPAQLFFDSAFDLLSIRDEIDRFDVLGPSSSVGNSLAARVTNDVNQINSVYTKIIWNSGNLSSATVGDGTGDPEKSDDFSLLEQFIRLGANKPGVYMSGDDIANEWSILAGSGAILMRTTQLPFSLTDGDHANRGEPVSPTMSPATTANLTGRLIAYGGCALLNDFDVMNPGAPSVEEYAYPNAGEGTGASAVISSQITNSSNSTATIVLSGFSYHYIRDAVVQFPPARVEHLEQILNYMGADITPPTTGIPVATFSNTLDNAYPNPFNPTTTIKYTIKERAHVSLRVYNAAGQLVRTLVDEIQSPDEVAPVKWHGLNDSGQNVSTGVYFYKMETNDFSQTKKMVLLK